MPIEHWMMFATFAEQRHFIYPRTDSYFGAIINGNMAAHAPTALAAFLVEKTDSLRYIIDPLVHAFQHPPRFVANSVGAVKTSIQKLAESYGSPITDIVGRHALSPAHLSDENDLNGLTERCLDFQSCRLANLMRDSDAMKYLDPEELPIAPHALVAPYFYMTETTYEDWLPVMSRAISHAKEIREHERIYGAVVVSQGVILDGDIRQEIADALNVANPDGYLLWVDNFDEQAAGGAELKGMLDLARRLRSGRRRDVIDLHGGYFSVLSAGVLGDGAFSGVTHGPEFGEFRSVVPVGGGIPISRYYLPSLHARLKYRDAQALLAAKGWLASAEVFHENVCGCAECTDTLRGDPGRFVLFGEGVPKLLPRRGGSLVRIDYPTQAAKKRCLQHYLQRKAIEYQFAATASRDQIVGDLVDGYKTWADVLGQEGVSHLKLWTRTLAPAELGRFT